MLRRKVSILLIGLLCFSSAGAFRVICHRSDGHIAIESADHNHCECPETAGIDHQDTLAGTAIDAPFKHVHCRDIKATLDVILPSQKNVTLSQSTIFALNASLNPVLNRTTCPFTHPATAWLYKLSVFYEPLRTIVLLT